MTIRNVIVQCLDESETRLAEEILRKNGPVSTSAEGVYVRGHGKDADVEELRGKGLFVEEIPAEPSLGWEKLEDEEELGPAFLGVAGGDFPPLPLSPLQEAAAAAPRVYLVQLKGPLRGPWKERLEEIGVDLTQYVPDFAFKTPLTAVQREKAESLDFVGRVVSYRRPRSSDLQILGGEEFARPMAPGGSLEQYEVWCDNADDVPGLARILAQDSRITGIEEGTHKIRFTCVEDSPVLEELGDLPQVNQVDKAPRYEILNEFARTAIGVDRPAQPPSTLPWNGKDVLVGVADSGVDECHPDLVNRIEKVVWSQPGQFTDRDGHGTHVCGTIAGDGTASGGRLKGVAPGARLYVQGLVNPRGEFSVPSELGKIFQEAYDKGVRIHNNSWGHFTEGRYVLGSYEVDKFVYDHPDFLVLFAAGNDGVQERDTPTDPPGQIGLLSLRSPAAAKNALSVGACCSSRTDGPYAGRPWRDYPRGPQNPPVADEPICGDLGYLAAFSSRGPSHDDRVKPDLVAPGTVILSARSSEGGRGTPSELFDGYYTFMSGTSMATPVVAGAAAIVRQYYLENGHSPSAALMKATLINATVWIDRNTVLLGEVGQPNYHQGFGRLDLAQILPVPGDGSGLRLVFADIARQSPEAIRQTGNSNRKQKWVRTVHVEAGLPLRITLAWTDRPGPGLLQDLDLVVSSPAGVRIAGNPSMKRSSWHTNDRRNNVEQVVLDNPEAGPYKIHVLGYNTPTEDQGFSLVVTGKLTSELLP